MRNGVLVEQRRPASTGGGWEDRGGMPGSRPWLKKESPHAERELLQHIEELEQANTERNVLMRMAAHELRNALGVILAGTKLLLNESSWKLNDKERGLVATIRHANSLMIRIVNDLVDMTGFEAGQFSVEREEVEFMSLVNNCVAVNGPLAEEKNVTLKVRPAVNRVCLCADPTRIEQVFNNVIGNAIKYSAPGGCVQVSVQADQHDVITTIMDHGPGMSVEEMEMLFKPFHTVRRGAGGEKGLGLGLVIARMIVIAHQGVIRVESEEGKGSTFFVSLPRAT